MNGMIRFDDKNLTISQLDIGLIRQVLLTDKFDSLHVSDAPAITPSFEDFALFASGGIEDNVKRAFRDHLVAQDRVELMHDLVLSVHQQLRALVPNREDLHVLVDDDAVTAAKQVKDLLPILIRASLGLQSLESDARAETTAQWRETAQRVPTEGVTTEFVVTSALYLIFKTELCQADKQDFYLQHVWAPRIHSEGPAYLRDVMDKQCNGYPLTKTWLKGLLENREVTEATPAFFRTLTRKGWVETILFRKDKATMLPEVFFFDQENIQLIRQVCQQAVAASALALHAGVTKRCEPTSELGMRREDLLLVLANNRSPTYEHDIASAVVALARAANSSIDEASLRSRTVAALRGRDPVIQLFDRRMQDAFVEVSVRDGARIPTKLQTGRLGHVGILAHESQTELERAAEESFCNKGLSFYASELATLSALARRIIDLVLTIHQDLIEKSFREAMSG
ncbi:hypothetical protein MHU86_21912 [Fragilaria crotonensis]|nr:hypothetical protein MHU86_21912 [Fragilaria crotonensis]